MLSPAREEPLFTRATTLLQVLALILTLCTPLVVFAWGNQLRLDRVEQQQGLSKTREEEREKDHDTLLEVRRDVGWIRKLLEEQRPKRR